MLQEFDFPSPHKNQEEKFLPTSDASNNGLE